MTQTPHLIFARSFARFFPEKPSAMNALQCFMASESESCQSLKRRIQTVLKSDFEEAAHYAKV